MPLKKRSQRSNKTQAGSASRACVLTHQVFIPLLIFTGILWFLYRSLFSFPVWFDETIGKAVFFGLPVWVYINTTGFRPVIDTFRLKKLKPGLLRGLAFGGIFGFITIFIRWLVNGYEFQPLLVFLTNEFWQEMLLALFTAFWETLFFFSFAMTVIQDRFKKWSLSKQVVLVTLIFLIFHIPNSFLRFDLLMVFPLLSLLGLFAIGQSLIFYREQNAYLLIMSHTIWGMVLLLYF